MLNVKWRRVFRRAEAIGAAKIGPLCVSFVGPRPLKGSTWQKILIFFWVFVRLGCAQFCQLLKVDKIRLMATTTTCIKGRIYAYLCAQKGFAHFFHANTGRNNEWNTNIPCRPSKRGKNMEQSNMNRGLCQKPNFWKTVPRLPNNILTAKRNEGVAPSAMSST